MTCAFYLDAGAEPIFAMLDQPPPTAPARSTAVLLCPPVGWQDVSSYRPRRDWARELAAAGHPTLRIDLPGTGDSGGDARDPGRFAAWAAAIAAAARWLRETSDRPRIAAVGIGLGGLALYRAAVDGAPVDDLVLWAGSGRGRPLVREQRAFARLEQAQQLNPEGTNLPDGALIAAGFLLSAETLSDLERFDVAELRPPGGVGRVLLLERDGMPIDESLRAALVDAGADVTTAPGEGFADMFMAEPQDARLGRAALATAGAWIAAGDPGTVGGDTSASAGSTHAARSAPAVAAQGRAELVASDGTRVRETPLFFPASAGRLFGVLTEPLGSRRDLCLVLLNAGAQRRIGVNRMWVELARRWSARGVASLRIDLEAIGDADGDSDRFTDLASFYVPEFVGQVRGVLDALVARGLPSRFVLLGLCSGAYWSFHTALADRRVASALMLNARVLIWDPELLTRRESGRLRRSAVSAAVWRRVVNGDISRDRVLTAVRTLGDRGRSAPGRVRATIADQRERTGGAVDELERLLDRLRDRGQRGLLLFTADEPVYDELERGGYLARFDRWPNLRLAADAQLRSGSGEDHTLRPLWLQQRVHGLLDGAIDQELEHAARMDAPVGTGGAIPGRGDQ